MSLCSLDCVLPFNIKLFSFARKTTGPSSQRPSTCSPRNTPTDFHSSFLTGCLLFQFKGLHTQTLISYNSIYPMIIQFRHVPRRSSTDRGSWWPSIYIYLSEAPGQMLTLNLPSSLIYCIEYHQSFWQQHPRLIDRNLLPFLACREQQRFGLYVSHLPGLSNTILCFTSVV